MLFVRLFSVMLFVRLCSVVLFVRLFSVMLFVRLCSVVLFVRLCSVMLFVRLFSVMLFVRLFSVMLFVRLFSVILFVRLFSVLWFVRLCSVVLFVRLFSVMLFVRLFSVILFVRLLSVMLFVRLFSVMLFVRLCFIVMSLCAAFGPAVVLHSRYMSGPFSFLFQCGLCNVNSLCSFPDLWAWYCLEVLNSTFSSPLGYSLTSSLFVSRQLKGHVWQPYVIVGKTHWSITCCYPWNIALLDSFSKTVPCCFHPGIDFFFCSVFEVCSLPEIFGCSLFSVFPFC